MSSRKSETELAAKEIDGLLVPPPEPNQPSYGSYNLNSQVARLVSIEGVEVIIPAGFNRLLLQPRQCGDFYAELEGRPRSFGHHGPTRAAAIKGVAAKADQVPA